MADKIFEAYHAAKILMDCGFDDEEFMKLAIRICEGIVERKAGSDKAKEVSDHLSQYLNEAIAEKKETDNG